MSTGSLNGLVCFDIFHNLLDTKRGIEVLSNRSNLSMTCSAFSFEIWIFYLPVELNNQYHASYKSQWRHTNNKKALCLTNKDFIFHICNQPKAKNGHDNCKKLLKVV